MTHPHHTALPDIITPRETGAFIPQEGVPTKALERICRYSTERVAGLPSQRVVPVVPAPIDEATTHVTDTDIPQNVCPEQIKLSLAPFDLPDIARRSPIPAVICREGKYRGMAFFVAAGQAEVIIGDTTICRGKRDPSSVQRSIDHGDTINRRRCGHRTLRVRSTGNSRQTTDNNTSACSPITSNAKGAPFHFRVMAPTLPDESSQPQYSTPTVPEQVSVNYQGNLSEAEKNERESNDTSEETSHLGVNVKVANVQAAAVLNRGGFFGLEPTKPLAEHQVTKPPTRCIRKTPVSVSS